ncbi:hypothetical protein ACFPRL_36100 [Pseudoclavibacter helvolus]
MIASASSAEIRARPARSQAFLAAEVTRVVTRATSSGSTVEKTSCPMRTGSRVKVMGWGPSGVARRARPAVEVEVRCRCGRGGCGHSRGSPRRGAQGVPCARLARSLVGPGRTRAHRRRSGTRGALPGVGRSSAVRWSVCSLPLGPQ